MEEVRLLQEDLFMWFIMFWCVVLVGLFGIGGFFMFRKFLKVFPKADGKSTLDWEEHYVESSLHLWNDEAKLMLNELVTPVPELFRPVAKQKSQGRLARLRWMKRQRASIMILLFVAIYKQHQNGIINSYAKS